jgi:competence protein ComFC
MDLKEFIYTVIFPRYCLLCHRYGKYLCSSCLDTKFIAHQEKFCHICQGLLRHKSDGRNLSFVHTPCRKRTRLDGLFAVWEYNESVKVLISAVKYRFQYRILEDLRKVMKYKYGTLPVSVDVIVPVPLHRQRKAWRGFNQAELLAGCLGWNLLPVLERVRDTRPQAKMNRFHRINNLTGSFTLKPGGDVSGKSILLVDDVATTGSTLEEAARCLKAHGAKAVYGFVLALEK